MGGFEVLREVREYNGDDGYHITAPDDGTLREGIPVDMWRALKPSDATGH